MVSPPGLHKYVNGPTPLLTETDADPSLLPLHETGVDVGFALNPWQDPGLTVVVADCVHPLASVTVTVYIPAVKPVITLVV